MEEIKNNIDNSIKKTGKYTDKDLCFAIKVGAYGTLFAEVALYGIISLGKKIKDKLSIKKDKKTSKKST